MNKHAIIILADGFEEVEAITPIDLLRRAGIAVTMLGLTSMEVKGSHDITIKAEMLLNDFDGKYDALILPGGPVIKIFSNPIRSCIWSKFHFNRSFYARPFCAAPSVFGKAGILSGKKATCFPRLRRQIRRGDFL